MSRGQNAAGSKSRVVAAPPRGGKIPGTAVGETSQPDGERWFPLDRHRGNPDAWIAGATIPRRAAGVYDRKNRPPSPMKRTRPPIPAANRPTPPADLGYIESLARSIWLHEGARPGLEARCRDEVACQWWLTQHLLATDRRRP